LITVLTATNWDSLIEQRPVDSTWYFMFYGEDCPACTAMAPNFIEAANRTKGLIRYGSVNCSEEAEMTQKYQIGHIPTFFGFHSDGYEEVKGSFTADRLLEGLGSHFKGCIVPFESRWFQETRNSAVLFTYSNQIPINWKLYSCRRSIRTGHSRDGTLRRQYGAPLVPAMFVINKAHRVHFKDMNEAIVQYTLCFTGQYNKPQPKVTYYLPFELKSECKAPEAAEHWSGSDIKFFQGDEDWPTTEIKAGDTYRVFHNYLASHD
jgi:thiol-disulfide isomerase/thioredoxin